MSHPILCTTSPNAAPPTVLLTRSFHEGCVRSPNHSHVTLPIAARGSDCQ